MIGPLRWLIYLLTYSDTERALLGSRRPFDVSGFGVNISLSDKDRILMDNLYVVKRYRAKKLTKKCSNKECGD